MEKKKKEYEGATLSHNLNNLRLNRTNQCLNGIKMIRRFKMKKVRFFKLLSDLHNDKYR